MNIFSNQIKKFKIKNDFILNSKTNLKNLKTKNTFVERFEFFSDKNLKKLEKRYQEVWKKNFDLKLIKKILKKSKIILDCGCGTGNLSLSLLKKTSLNDKIYLANDINIKNLKKLKKNFHKLKIQKKYIVSEFSNLPLKKNCVDFVISFGSLHHDRDPLLSLKKISSVVKKKGYLLLWVYLEQPLLRKLTDDYFRNKINNDKSYNYKVFLKEITLLAKFIQDNKSKIIIKKNLNSLNVKKGTFKVQEFIFRFFLRNTYNHLLGQKFSYYENLDWFAAENNFTFSKKKICSELKKNKFNIIYLKKTMSGISLIAKKV